MAKRVVAKWSKPSLLGRGGDILRLTEDERGRLLLERLPGRGFAYRRLTIPVRRDGGGWRRRFTDWPTLGQAQAFANVNGYERIEP